MRTLKLMVANLLLMTAGAAHASDATTREWVDVTLETPGSLGVEILYKVDKLSDVKHLRVNGPINSDDWATIKNISTIESLDLSKTNAAYVPKSQFSGVGSLSYISLPATLTSIETEAFKSTSITDINIPASVTTIGESCFYSCKSLSSVTFSDNSQLNSLGSRTFYQCTALTGIAIPDQVQTIASETFAECTTINNVKLPANLKTIEQSAFYNTSELKLIDMPENLTSIGNWAFYNTGLTAVSLPAQVSSLGNYCFYNCTNLTEVTLPACVHSYTSNQFQNCSRITKITCRTATPPAAEGDPFSGFSKANATLCVPEFAIVNFKLHTYWLNFGKIEGGVTSSFWEINEALSLTNNRRMDGTPSINLATGARFTVGGSAPQALNQLNITYDFSSYWSPKFGQMINSSPSMTAQNVQTSFSLGDGRWFFIVMPYDVNVQDVTHSSPSASFIFRYYDGAQRAASGTGNSWKNVEENGTLKAGQGYILQTNKAGTIYLPASAEGRTQVFNPNACTMELAQNTSDDTANAGWNYVGNPYTSYYDMYYTMLTCPITVWNSNSDNYTAYSLIDDNVVLQPGQPFFIQASDDVKSIEFGTLGRQFTTEISRVAAAPAFGSEAAKRYLFNLTLTCDGHTDASRVVINEEASLSYETSRDAAKFFSDNAAIAQLYTIDADGNTLAINERPEGDATVKLGLYSPAAQHMTLTAGRMDGEAILHDALTGKDITLKEGTAYEFETSSTGNIDNRFTLTMRKPDNSTGIGTIESTGSAVVKCTTGAIVIEGAEGLDADIYTVDGRSVMSQRISSGSYTATLPAGIYIVKVGNTSAKCIVK